MIEKVNKALSIILILTIILMTSFTLGAIFASNTDSETEEVFELADGNIINDIDVATSSDLENTAEEKENNINLLSMDADILLATAPQAAMPELMVLSGENNHIKLDPNNQILNVPESYSVARKGTENFSIVFEFTITEIPEDRRRDFVSIVNIPRGFVVENIPDISGGTFLKRKNDDESTDIEIKLDSGAVSVTGSIYVRQDPEDIFSHIYENDGKHIFSLKNYIDYNSSNRTLLTTPDSEDGYTSHFILQDDTKLPDWEITNISNTYDWMPGELVDDIRYVHSFGSELGGKHIDAFRRLYREKPFKIQFKKTEGHFPIDTVLKFPIPEIDKIFKYGDRSYLSYGFVSEDGINDYGTYDDFAEEIVGAGPEINLKNRRKRDIDYFISANNANISRTDLYYKAGTFTIVYMPEIYYNRVKRGATYTADDNPSVEYINPVDSSEVKIKAAEPLEFKFKQGTSPIVAISGANEVNIREDNLPYNAMLEEISQQSSSNYKYNDSTILYSNFYLADGRGNDFKIYDNLKVTYEFGEELFPVYFGELRTSKAHGLSYRIFVKNAVTGNIEKIYLLLNAQAYEDGYTAQVIDGVTETVIPAGNITEWNFAEADAANNKKYISKFEVLSDTLSFLAYTSDQKSNTAWFKYKLRAYNNRLSDNSNIPNDFLATVERRADADQIRDTLGYTLDKEYVIKTTELKDNLDLKVDDLSSEKLEVNNHEDTNVFASYHIVKYVDTMDYNKDQNGNDISVENDDYNPPVVEVSGAAVGLTDMFTKDDNRLLGIWDATGIYHDLKKLNIDVESAPYVIEGVSKWSDTKKTVYNSVNNTGTEPEFSGKLYDIKKICERLGIEYADKLVMGLDNVNTWDVKTSKSDKKFNLFLNRVKPGYMNYNNAIGIAGSTDLPKNLDVRVKLFTLYKDYYSEVVEKNSVGNTNAKLNINSKSATLVKGSKLSAISIENRDYFVNPYSRYMDNRGSKGELYDENYTEIDSSKIEINSLKQLEQQGTRFEFFKVDMNHENGEPQISYKDAQVDFEGTDKRLISLVNAVSFQAIYSRGIYWDFGLEYKLSDGRTIKKDNLRLYAHDYSNSPNDRLYYIIPEVDDDVYLTDIKITFPNDLNWGDNKRKLSKDTNGNLHMPEVGLARVLKTIPNNYPNTNEVIGSVDLSENTDEYDKLPVKAVVRFKNIFGEEEGYTAGDTSAYLAKGNSAKIAYSKVLLETLESYVDYNTNSTNQGAQIYVSISFALESGVDDAALLTDKRVKIRPTAYIKVDKNFIYTKDENDRFEENCDVSFRKPGLGVNDSGSLDYGLLIVSYDNVADENLTSPYEGSTRARYFYHMSFPLLAKYDAEPVELTPIKGIWTDILYDANRDNSGPGNASGLKIDLKPDSANMVEDGPVGRAFGNEGKVLLSPNTHKAKMFYRDFTKKHKIQKQAILGTTNFVMASYPLQQSLTNVKSVDMVDVENIFSNRIYITGASSFITNDWEVYIPIPKKGDTYKSIVNGDEIFTEKNMYSLDFMNVDVQDLDNQGIAHTIYYTTDANPAINGYESASKARYTTEIPALEDITMIKLVIASMEREDKGFIDVNFKLHERKALVGKQIDSILTYSNFKQQNSTDKFFGEIGNTSNTGLYILDDIRIHGKAFEDKNYNSIFDYSKDNIFEGLELKAYNFRKPNVLNRFFRRATVSDVKGEEVIQANDADLLNSNEHISDMYGNYLVRVPHDGKWVLESVHDKDHGLVKDNIGNNIRTQSIFNRDTGLAIIEVNAKEQNGLGIIDNANVGVYKLPVMSMEDKFISIDSSGENVNLSIENKPPLANSSISVKDAESALLIDVIDNGDGTAKIIPKKTGLAYLKLTCEDGYGSTVEKTAKVIVYSGIDYDSNLGIGGVAPDTGRYYPSVDENGDDAKTDLAILKDMGDLRRQGYHFLGWGTEKEVGETTIIYPPNTSFKVGSLDHQLKLYALWGEDSPVYDDLNIIHKLSGDTPYKQEVFKFSIEGTNQAEDIEILGEGEANFRRIIFSRVGEFVYTIKQKPQGYAGYTFDASEYTVKYIVTKDQNSLNVDKKIYKGQDLVSAIEYINTYTLPSHKVSFYSKRGILNPVVQTVKHGQKANEPSGISRKRYILTGWYLGDKKYDFDAPVTEDIELYASWEREKGGGRLLGRSAKSEREVPEIPVEKITVAHGVATPSFSGMIPRTYDKFNVKGMLALLTLSIMISAYLISKKKYRNK